MTDVNAWRTTVLKISAALAAWAVLVLSSVGAGLAADDAAKLIGRWDGSLVVDGRPMAINLAVRNVQLGEDSADFHYGVPRSCRLFAEYSGEHDGAHFFSFKTANGGFCDRLVSGFMTLRLDGDTRLAFEVSSKDLQTKESGTLAKRAGRTAEAVIGSWKGSVVADGRPVAVTLDVPDLEIGADRTSLHYGVPRNCRLSAEYAGAADGNHVFAFKESNGGFCDRLINGALTLKPGDDGALAFEVASADGRLKETATLAKAAR